MAIVTFSSPTLHRDVTVYATAGDTKTVLSLAEKNDVKIEHDCREGNCGSCLIEVKYLAGKPKMAIDLTTRKRRRFSRSAASLPPRSRTPKSTMWRLPIVWPVSSSPATKI